MTSNTFGRFGLAIDRAMTSQGVTLIELAEHCRIYPHTFIPWFEGFSVPAAKRILAISLKLNLDYQQLERLIELDQKQPLPRTWQGIAKLGLPGLDPVELDTLATTATANFISQPAEV